MTTSLSTLVNQALPALSGSQLTYNQQHNIYLSNGYTSQAGNTYFMGLRLSDRIVITYDFGQGYAHLFLNGIRIYGFDGNSKRLIATRDYYSVFFDEAFARQECREMIMEYLRGEMKLLNCEVNQAQLNEFSYRLVAEAMKAPQALA